MPDSLTFWNINPSSRFHFHTWPDGVAVYLEGEGGTYLLSPFAAELLQWLSVSELSIDAISERVRSLYPDDTLEDIRSIVEQNLSQLRGYGLVSRAER